MSLYQQIQSVRFTPTPRSNKRLPDTGQPARAAEWKRLSDMLWTLQIEIVRLQLTEEDADRVAVLEAEVDKIEWARLNLKSEYWRNV